MLVTNTLYTVLRNKWFFFICFSYLSQFALLQYVRDKVTDQTPEKEQLWTT